MHDTIRHVASFLDAWEALCLAAGTTTGRRCLRAHEALHLPLALAEPVAALARTLVDLGYPQAMVGGPALGQALRRLRGLRDERGRFLSMSHARGAAIWYVTGP